MCIDVCIYLATALGEYVVTWADSLFTDYLTRQNIQLDVVFRSVQLYNRLPLANQNVSFTH